MMSHLPVLSLQTISFSQAPHLVVPGALKTSPTFVLLLAVDGWLPHLLLSLALLLVVSKVIKE